MFIAYRGPFTDPRDEATFIVGYEFGNGLSIKLPNCTLHYEITNLNGLTSI
jgi:hypothetical protein